MPGCRAPGRARPRWSSRARRSSSSSISSASWRTWCRCSRRLVAGLSARLGLAGFGGGIGRLGDRVTGVGGRLGGCTGLPLRGDALPLCDSLVPARLLLDDLGDRLLRGHPLGVRGLGRLGVEQARLNRLLRTGVATLAHTRALADPVTQVVELRPANVAAGSELDALDLGRMHREHALDANAEGLLAHRERLARTVALALDDRALEDLDAAASPLDHLEVNLHAVARREVWDAAHLRALDGCDYAAHEGEGGRAQSTSVGLGAKLSAGANSNGSEHPARSAPPSPPLRGRPPLPEPCRVRGCGRGATPRCARGGPRAGPRARSSRDARPGACSADTPGVPRARR